MNTIDIERIDKKPDKRPKNTDPNEVYKLLKGGFTVQEIATQKNVTDKAIYALIDRHNLNPTKAKFFKEAEADLLAIKRADILNSIDIKSIKATPAVQRATMYGIFYDKERLERGQVTEITANTSLIIDVNSILKSLKQ